jgi:hypothetical protein
VRPLRHLVAAGVLVAMMTAGVLASPEGQKAALASRWPAANTAGHPVLWGVTVDDIAHLPALTAALAGLPERPVTRVYFDIRRPASYYAAAVARIGRVSTVMGELLDSSDEKAVTVPAMAARVASYLRMMRRQVAIWEIGNEVNGNWTGRPAEVAAKLATAYDEVTAAGGSTALTLFANDFGPDHCGDGAAELTPAQFTRDYIPARVAYGLRYVFLSYYPADCGGREPAGPELAGALRQLHALYPRATLGMGEIGMPAPATRRSLGLARQIMRWAYSLNPRLRYYAGGYFWWNAAEDALRPGAPLRSALRAAFRLEALALR